MHSIIASVGSIHDLKIFSVKVLKTQLFFGTRDLEYNNFHNKHSNNSCSIIKELTRIDLNQVINQFNNRACLKKNWKAL